MVLNLKYLSITYNVVIGLTYLNFKKKFYELDVDHSGIVDYDEFISFTGKERNASVQL